MPVLGERRMIRHLTVETQAAEPAIGQVEVDFVTQPPLRADPVAVTHQKHADHQLGIDRGTSHRAVVRLKMGPNARQVDEPVDGPEHVIARNVAIQAELVEQSSLVDLARTHHATHSSPRYLSESALRRGDKPWVFQHNRWGTDI